MTDTVAPVEGGYYRTRDAGIRGPMGPDRVIGNLFWLKNGQYHIGRTSPLDLIARVWVYPTEQPPPVVYDTERPVTGPLPDANPMSLRRVDDAEETPYE